MQAIYACSSAMIYLWNEKDVTIHWQLKSQNTHYISLTSWTIPLHNPPEAQEITTLFYNEQVEMRLMTNTY